MPEQEAMYKTSINLPLDLVVAARESVAKTPGAGYQDVLRRWMRLGMEAERAGAKGTADAPATYKP